jgi:MOSC domain-containing protein YiiM
MEASITSIFVAPASGEQMRPLTSAELEAGCGIVGDRYHAGIGKFSEKLLAAGTGEWQVTLIESEEIDQFLQSEALSFGHGDFRRNIVTTGVRLNPLVGACFTVDGVLLEGIRLCEPCAYLAALLTDGLLPTMVGRSGLRARILTSGTISIGGSIGGSIEA